MCFYKSLDFMDLLKKVEIKICSGSLPEVGGWGGGWSGEAIFTFVV